MDPRLAPLHRTLEKDGAPPVLLVVGPDEMAASGAEALVYDHLVEQHGAQGLETTRVRVPPGNPADALEPLLTVSMFARHGLVVVQFADKVDAKSLGALADYLQRPVGSRTLLLRAPDVDRRAGWARALEKAGAVLRIEALNRRTLPRWLTQRAHDAGWTLDSAAAALIVEAVGDDPLRLQSELDKLICFVGPQQRRIERADVEACVTHTREEVVFRLASALGQGDVATAARTLRNALEHAQNAVGLVGLMAHHIRLLAQVVERIREGASEAAIAAELKRPPWQVRRLVAEARRTTPAAVEQVLAWLVEADRALKSSRLDPLLVLERVVVRAAAGGRATPNPPAA